ncbi:hypothetical protein [uncultured Aquitalea sp.]|uniref:hypothetical protein n=1 Tax=uncultured Aquitalea sp. TaxID=540272 RepID=UPI0025EE9577|nr:hypothetical protein [uncultured Aquitalea sp.]
MLLAMLSLVTMGIVISLLAYYLGDRFARFPGGEWDGGHGEFTTSGRLSSADSWANRAWPAIRDRVQFPPLYLPAQQVASRLNPGKVYLVDPANLSCTCNYFLIRGARAAIGSKERLCRHLRNVYASQGNPSALIRMVLLDDAHYGETDQLWSGEVDGIPVVIAWREGDPWVAVYTRASITNGEPDFQRYVFHLDNAAWGEGRIPRANAQSIRQMLADWFADPHLAA